MSKGFLQKAKREICTNPGQSAQQIARKLLESGEVDSMAQNPEMSLVATLSKHYGDIGVKRSKIDGLFRYFPSNDSNNHIALPNYNVPGQAPVEAPADEITITVPSGADYAKFADALVTLGHCQNLNDAFLLMLSEGKESIRRSKRPS